LCRKSWFKKAKETTGTFIFEICPHISDHDFRNFIKFNYNDEWQSLWINYNNNKFREIKQTILPYEMFRRDEVILVHLRIGHTCMTHGYLIAKEDPPACTTCRAIITVKHILLECRHSPVQRNAPQTTGNPIRDTFTYSRDVQENSQIHKWNWTASSYLKCTNIIAISNLCNWKNVTQANNLAVDAFKN